MARDEFLLPFEELLGNIFHVTALDTDGFVGLHLDEFAAERFDLLLRLRTNIGDFHHGAKPTRSGDGLQSGDARAEDHHLGGTDGSSGGGHHREQLAESVRREQHGFVAAQVRLRTEYVHPLRTGDTRNGIHCENRNTGATARCHDRGIRRGPKKREKHRARFHRGNLRRSRRVDFQEDIRSGIKTGSGGHQFGAGFQIRFVSEEGRQSSALFHEHGEAFAHKTPHSFWGERNAVFVRLRFLRDGQFHATQNSERDAGQSSLTSKH